MDLISKTENISIKKYFPPETRFEQFKKGA